MIEMEVVSIHLNILNGNYQITKILCRNSTFSNILSMIQKNYVNSFAYLSSFN